jgi:RnfABCDGE-type electron transport complex E subunit
MSTQSYRQITHNGLWKNNPALVQLLGLCPLLAVTASVVNALGLAAATLFVLVTSNLCVSLIRNVVTESIRLPAFVLIIAAAVTGTELLMQAYAYELYQILGIFLPLITTNCVILGRADAFAAKNPVAPAVADGFMMGMGFRLSTVSTGGDSRITWHGRRICQYGFTSWAYGRRLDLGCSGGLHRSFVSDLATRSLYYYRPLDCGKKCYRYTN